MAFRYVLIFVLMYHCEWLMILIPTQFIPVCWTTGCTPPLPPFPFPFRMVILQGTKSLYLPVIEAFICTNLWHNFSEWICNNGSTTHSTTKIMLLSFLLAPQAIICFCWKWEVYLLLGLKDSWSFRFFFPFLMRWSLRQLACASIISPVIFVISTSTVTLIMAKDIYENKSLCLCWELWLHTGRASTFILL